MKLASIEKAAKLAESLAKLKRAHAYVQREADMFVRVGIDDCAVSINVSKTMLLDMIQTQIDGTLGELKKLGVES